MPSPCANGKTIKADILTPTWSRPSRPMSNPERRQAARPGGDRKAASDPGGGGNRQTTGDPGGGGPGAADSKISRVDAQGHVFVTNGLDTGRGDYGVYNADSGICTLIDNVVITRAKTSSKGNTESWT